MTTNFSVTISQDGRGGGILYQETGVGEYETWWEFASGRGVLAFPPGVNEPVKVEPAAARFFAAKNQRLVAMP